MDNVSKVGLSCTGCHSCEQICTTKAIKLESNGDGFMYPSISDACIYCGLCSKFCHTLKDVQSCFPNSGYAAYLRDTSTLMNSTSGGVFWSMASYILSLKGIVIGCKESPAGFVAHTIIDKIEDLYQLQGSKYVESDLGAVYSTVKELILNDVVVLFSGTPCQVAGLKTFLGRDYNHLFTIDIVCHGVPSQTLYRDYLKWEETKNQGRIESFSFRSKLKHGWSLTYRIGIKRNNKTIEKEHLATLSPYYYQFLQGMNYRESCYSCKYAKNERVSDVTLGDFWGIENVDSEMNNLNGVSAVLINTQQGNILWKACAKDLEYKSVNVNSIISHNGQLRTPSKRPAERDMYYRDWSTKGFNYVAKHYVNSKLIVIDGVKDFIPNKYRQKIKKVIKNVRK